MLPDVRGSFSVPVQRLDPQVVQTQTRKMKRDLKKFGRRLFWLSGATCCAMISAMPGNLHAQQSTDAATESFATQKIGTNEYQTTSGYQAEEGERKIAQTAAISPLNPRVAKMSRRLNNIGWELFEQKIVDLWGVQLDARAEDEQGTRVRIIIPGDQEFRNEMVIDRLNNALTFEGSPRDAENWEALIGILDNTEETGFSNISLVGMGNASAATIRRAVHLLGLPEEESGSLAASMKFAPFRNADSSEPQRRSQLRSIPFQPSNKKASAQNGPRAQRQPTPAPSTPTPPRVTNPGSAGSVTPLPGSGGESSVNTTARISNASSSTGALKRATQPASSRKEIPAESANSSPANSVLNGGINVPATPQPAGGRRLTPANPALPTIAEPRPVGAPQPTPARTVRFTKPVVQETGDDETQIVEIADDRLNGQVKIQVIPGMNAVALIGAPEDVAKVRLMIEKIVKTAADSAPVSKIRELKNSDSTTLQETIDTVYEAGYAANNGPAVVVALTNPDRLLVMGQQPAIDIIDGLIDQLDRPAPEGEAAATDYVMHRLKFISAQDAASRLQAYFTPANDQDAAGFQNQQLQGVLASAGPASIVVDYRANALLIKGNQRVQEVARGIIAELDVDESDATHVVRFFPVFNALASDIAVILQETVNGGLQGQPNVNAPNAQVNNQNQPVNNAGFGGQNELASRPVTALQMTTIDENGRTVKSGILLEVRFSADTNSNQIMVTGPEKSMDLVEALIKQLDRIPDAETQIKVFTILNGDATELLTTLQTIFGSDQAQGNNANAGTQGIGQLPLQTLSNSQGASLINLNFAVDARTNSILATGPAGDLELIEDLLNRLDERDLAVRRNRIYRLSNAPAEDVADAISTWLTDRQAIFDADPTSQNALASARRQVVVVPELVSNSLIISAVPEYFDEVVALIEELDRRPAMVRIRVLIAEVNLNKLNEFGIEVGIQDSLLFDRGLGTIGFPFNQSGIGNGAVGTRELLAGQALSNLGIGRTSDAGYGGLVLSAGNESINILMRALQDRAIARVMSTPDIMTVDNLQAQIQVGQTVSRVRGTNQGNNLSGAVSLDVEDVNVGVILQVTPRVSPDGMIIMSVDATNSSLGSEADGVAVFANDNQVIRSPPINITQAQTTIMARSGQSVAFSGLIQDRVADAKRGTPILSDLPVIGPLFSFETEERRRSELLIILTPYLIDNEAALEASNQMSYSRMNWCRDDVAAVFGNIDGYDTEFQTTAAAMTIYPDQDPTGSNPEYLPLENGQYNNGQQDGLEQYQQDLFEQPYVEPADGLPPVPQASPSPSDATRGAGVLRGRGRTISRISNRQ